MDEVFGEENFVNIISVKKTGAAPITESIFDYLIWFAKDRESIKLRRLFQTRKDATVDPKMNTLVDEVMYPYRATSLSEADVDSLLASGAEWARVNYPIVSQDFDFNGDGSKDYPFNGRLKECGKTRHWTFKYPVGLERIEKAGRIFDGGGKSLGGVVKHSDRIAQPLTNSWEDVKGEEGAVYVVQTAWRILERCILMTTDPGDLVLDPTCGSGTTAYVAEQWGRRWITIDTSRVAIALARARVMGARYPYFILADSSQGQKKDAEVSGRPLKSTPTHGSIRHGFVYERVPHITLKSIADNANIDTIWEQMQPAVTAALDDLNAALLGHRTPFKVDVGARAGTKIDFTTNGVVTLPSGEIASTNRFMEWEVPRYPPADWPASAQNAVRRFWAARTARQREIDASVAKAEFEYLYDKPYADNSKVRVAGPFTVESLSPHITVAVGPDDELIDLSGAGLADDGLAFDGPDDFASMILKNLRVAGVQQAHKEDRITFTSLVGWPGELICAEGRYLEGNVEKRAGIFIGPEFGTVSRPDLVQAAREAGDAGFDVLVACAFNYDAHSAEFSKLGRVPVLRARMNPDLHMAGDLAATGAGNLFVIFGEPDIKIEDAGKDADGAELIRVKVSGVDVFKPQTGAVESEGTDGIALWMLDTDYNEESFFVRHAYFLGANDPYKALKTTLKAEIDEEAWSSLNSDTSRPFPKPTSGRIAVKVINHLGDEVMKVFEAR